MMESERQGIFWAYQRELGRVHLIEPTSPLFENEFAWAAPAFAKQNIFVRNDRELRCDSLPENSGPKARK